MSLLTKDGTYAYGIVNVHVRSSTMIDEKSNGLYWAALHSGRPGYQVQGCYSVAVVATNAETASTGINGWKPEEQENRTASLARFM